MRQTGYVAMTAHEINATGEWSDGATGRPRQEGTEDDSAQTVPDVHLRSLVTHRLGLELLENLPASRPEVQLLEGRVPRHVPAPPAGEVVHDRDLKAPASNESATCEPINPAPR